MREHLNISTRILDLLRNDNGQQNPNTSTVNDASFFGFGHNETLNKENAPTSSQQENNGKQVTPSVAKQTPKPKPKHVYKTRRQHRKAPAKSRGSSPRKTSNR